MRVCIDPGHGGTDSGAVGNGYLEKNLTLPLSLNLRDFLINCGIDVVLTRDKDVTLDATPRVDAVLNSKADICLSIHFNAATGKGSGVETIYQMNNANSQRLAEHVLEEISGLGIPKRKAYSKVSNNNPSQDYYFMLRRTRPITSVIVECLFIDNVEDVKFLSGPQALQNLASAIGRGVLDYFNLNGNIVKTPIMGKAVATADQMEKYLHSINIDAPYYAKIYLAEGAKEGVRGDIAFAQSLHETNYFRFGGNVSSAQNNFAGIGSTGAGVNGASFETPEEGIRAQIQHLKAYASKDPLNGQKVDPRFDLIKRGSAPNVEDLDGKWAVPGIGYGRSIIDILDKILADVVKQDDWAKPYMDNLKTLGIIQDPHNQDDPVKWGELAAVITRTIENLKGK